MNAVAWAVAFAAGWAAGRALSRSRERGAARLAGLLLHECRGCVTALLLALQGAEEGRAFASDQALRIKSLALDLDDLLGLELASRSLEGGAGAALRDVASGAVEELRPAFERARVSLRAELPEAAVRIRADPERAGRALRALLLHARKFQRGGTVRLSAAGPSLRVEYEGMEEPAALRRAALPRPVGEDPGEGAFTRTGSIALTGRLLRAQGAAFEVLAEEGGRRELRVEYPAAAGGGAP